MEQNPSKNNLIVIIILGLVLLVGVFLLFFQKKEVQQIDKQVEEVKAQKGVFDTGYGLSIVSSNKEEDFTKYYTDVSAWVHDLSDTTRTDWVNILRGTTDTKSNEEFKKKYYVEIITLDDGSNAIFETKSICCGGVIHRIVFIKDSDIVIVMGDGSDSVLHIAKEANFKLNRSKIDQVKFSDAKAETMETHELKLKKPIDKERKDGQVVNGKLTDGYFTGEIAQIKRDKNSPTGWYAEIDPYSFEKPLYNPDPVFETFGKIPVLIDSPVETATLEGELLEIDSPRKNLKTDYYDIPITEDAIIKNLAIFPSCREYMEMTESSECPEYLFNNRQLVFDRNEWYKQDYQMTLSAKEYITPLLEKIEVNEENSNLGWGGNFTLRYWSIEEEDRVIYVNKIKEIMSFINIFYIYNLEGNPSTLTEAKSTLVSFYMKDGVIAGFGVLMGYRP